jgi:hypothetical protein
MIQETMARYAVAYDERRLDILADVFTEDAIFAFSIAGGSYGEYTGRQAVVDWLHEVMLGQFDQRRHSCNNFILEELDGYRAAAAVYFSLFASAEETELVTTGFYRVNFRKEDGRWRICYVFDGLDRAF